VEQPLETATEWFHALMMNAADAVALLDDKGTILYQSPSVERILGQRPEQLEGKSFSDLTHPDDMQQAVSLFKSVLENHGKTFTCQLRVRHKDGSWRTIEATAQNLLDDPTMGGIVVNYHDITERLKVSQELARSQKEYRLLAENLSDVVWTVDANFRYTYLSPSVTSLLGYSVEEAMALSMKEDMPPTSIQSVLRVMGEAAAKEAIGSDSERRSVTLELEMTHKEGATLWVENKITCLRDQQGRVTGYMGVSRDFTERRDASRRLEESIRKLERTLGGTIQATTEMVDCIDSYTANPQRRVPMRKTRPLSSSDQAFAVIHALATEKGISYSDALDQLILNRPHESQGDPDELAKTKADLQQAKDEVRKLEVRLMRRANKPGSSMPKMNEEDWARLARLGQNGDTSVFMREVREKGLLPYD
jgi:PAS domain S-box-containing protein